MKTWVAYALLVPTIVAFLLCGLFPMAGVGYLSLFSSDLLHDDVWVGFANYRAVFADPRWVASAKASLFYAATSVMLHIGGGIVLALLAYNVGGRWMGMARFLFYLPTFTGGLIIAQMWRWLLHPTGWFVLGLKSLGVVFWESAPAVMTTITISHASSCVGGYAVLFLSLLYGTSRELIDAARIDGASTGAVSRRILLPSLGSSVVLLSMLVFIGAFQMWETPRFIANGAPDGKSATMMFDVWHTAFVRNEFGLASAKTIIMGMVLALGIGGSRLIQKRSRRGT